MPSFFFRIDEISVRQGAEQQYNPRNTGEGVWNPPKQSGLFQTMVGQFYHWQDGRVQCTQEPPELLTRYCCTTVFTQEPDCDKFVALNVNASTSEIDNSAYNWTGLGFTYRDVHDIKCSDIHIVVDHEKLAVKPNFAWGTNLFPRSYHSAGNNTRTGLIGDLSLILALVGFSRPPSQLVHAMTSLQQMGSWQPRGNLLHGRM